LAVQIGRWDRDDCVFAAMSLLNWHDGHSWRWTGGIAVFFLAATVLYPPR